MPNWTNKNDFERLVLAAIVVIGLLLIVLGLNFQFDAAVWLSTFAGNCSPGGEPIFRWLAVINALLGGILGLYAAPSIPQLMEGIKIMGWLVVLLGVSVVLIARRRGIQRIQLKQYLQPHRSVSGSGTGVYWIGSGIILVGVVIVGKLALSPPTACVGGLL
jgi:hypothetical protein